MYYLQCLGNAIKLPSECTVQSLHRRCANSTAVHSALVSSVGKTVSFKNALFVGFDDGGPAIEVPPASVDLVVELLTRVHNSALGYAYDPSAYRATEGDTMGTEDVGDDDTVMSSAA